MDTKALDPECAQPLECIDPVVGTNLTAYEFGWLADPEARQFELHLQRCRACFWDLKTMQPVWSVLQDRPDLIPDESQSSGMTWLGNNWRQVFLAVSMLLIVGIIYLIPPPEGKDLSLAQETLHLRQLPQNSPIAQGLQALSEGHLQVAQALFQKALAENSESYEANYLSGVVLLKEAERDRFMDRETLNAIRARLQKASAISQNWPNPIYIAQGYYYLARAYWLGKEPARALDLLVRIEQLPPGGSDLESLRARAAELKKLCRP